MSHIFIMHVLYEDRMCAQSIGAHTAPLFFKSKIVKLLYKIKMSTTNYLPSLIAGLHFPPLFITMKLDDKFG